MHPGSSRVAWGHDGGRTPPVVLKAVAGAHGETAAAGDERPEQRGADQLVGPDPVRRGRHSPRVGRALACRAPSAGRGGGAGCAPRTAAQASVLVLDDRDALYERSTGSVASLGSLVMAGRSMERQCAFVVVGWVPL